MNLPSITVRQAIEALSKLDPEAKLHAWAPGSYLPVACVMSHIDRNGRALMEINVPPEAALSS